jgi:signal transduction histidine kinase
MNRVSIQAKILLLVFVLVMVAVGTGIIQRSALNHTVDSYSNIVDEDMARMNALHDIRDAMVKVDLEITKEFLRSLETGTSSILNLLEGTEQTINESFDTYRDLSEEENEQQLAELKDVVDSIGDFVDYATYYATAPTESEATSIETISPALEAAYQQLLDSVDKLITEEQEIISEESEEIRQNANDAIASSGRAIVVDAVLSITIGLFVVAQLRKPINALSAGATRIANGDFSHKIEINSKDELGSLASTFNDMAERLKGSYQRIAIEAERDEAIMKSMSEGLIATDSAGKVTLFNKTAVDIFDLSSEENIIGRTVSDFFELYPSDKARAKPISKSKCPVAIAINKARSTDAVYYLRKGSDKTPVAINFSCAPVVYEDKPQGAVVALRDVTHEREVDRMKTEFISLASHQLRTPLSAIKWFTEMLLSGDAGKLKKEQADYAQNVADSAERMIQLVNSLLNISRIESGRIMVDPEPTDLRMLINGIISDLEGKIKEKEHAVVVSVHSSLPKINLDARLIGQVYLNLLTNAIKYTPKGGDISVLVSKKGDEVISQVTDNGLGIPKQDQKRIFEKFFRAENVSAVETDGTGLGLYLIKSIIESSGGKLWFESKEDEGTSFWFSLPMSGMKPKKGEVTLDG